MWSSIVLIMLKICTKIMLRFEGGNHSDRNPVNLQKGGVHK